MTLFRLMTWSRNISLLNLPMNTFKAVILWPSTRSKLSLIFSGVLSLLYGISVLNFFPLSSPAVSISLDFKKSETLPASHMEKFSNWFKYGCLNYLVLSLLVFFFAVPLFVIRIRHMLMRSECLKSVLERNNQRKCLFSFVLPNHFFWIPVILFSLLYSLNFFHSNL